MHPRSLPALRPVLRQSLALLLAVGLSTSAVGLGSAFADEATTPGGPATTLPAPGSGPGSTEDPVTDPTGGPTEAPTVEPTDEPTGEPTDEPTDEHTDEPTDEPTEAPTTDPANGPEDDAVAEAAGEVAGEVTGVRGAPDVLAQRAAGPAWSCPPEGLLFQSTAGGVSTEVIGVDLVTGDFGVLTTADGVRLNAVGYNVVDNYVYGWDNESSQLVRVGADGGVDLLGVPSGMTPPTGSLLSGDVDPQGFYWTQGNSGYVKVDLTTSPPSVVDEIPNKPSGGADVAFDPRSGRLWSFGNGESVTWFDFTTRAWSVGTLIGSLSGSTGQLGAMYADEIGNIYGSFNGDGSVWRVDTDTLRLRKFTDATASGQNDGARCSRAPLGLELGDAAASYGTTVSADGPVHVLQDDYDVATRSAGLMLGTSIDAESDARPSSDANADDTTDVDDEDAVAGPLTPASGAPFAAPVRVTNNTATPATLAAWLDVDRNGTFEPGERSVVVVPASSGSTSTDLGLPALTGAAPSTLRLRVIPGAVANPAPGGFVDGGEVEDHLVRPAVVDVVDSKSADPADGSVVDTGQVVTYTLSFANNGTAPGTVARDDVLIDVLDDADLVTPPAASTPALTVSGIAGGRFEVRGTLQPGESATVSYSVRVRPPGQRANNSLGNVLAGPGEPPPPCGAGDPDCTVHPMPQLVDSKIVTPSSGSTVTGGQDLTYTLRFENTGTAPGAVARDDVLTDVLDDATVIAAPTSSDPALGVSPIAGGRFEVRGILQPGQVVTVTYAVRVLPDGQRGNNRLGNVLVGPGQTPPGDVCAGDDCTVNFVPEIVDEKTSDPASRTPVLPGDQITYTLRFRNLGTAPGPVSRDDVLSGVLDDAVLVTGPTASDPALTVSPVTAGRITVTGTLQPGQVVTVSYTARVKPDAQRVADGGDNALRNFLLAPGGPPPDQCLPSNPDCVVHGVPLVTDSKGSVPADGSRLLPGDLVTYRLTFRNDGQAPGQVAKDDVVTDVVDDADIVDPPASNDPALTVTPIAGGRFRVNGTLAIGQVVVVTYSARVLVDADRVARGGNDLLRNTLVPRDAQQSPCAPADDDCTVHGVPRLVESKSVDPASGTTVVQGDRLTYRLTFVNEGQAPGDVAQQDVVSGVLDDARLVTPPTASSPALAVSPITDGRFSVTGSLAAGATVTVTYVVEVLPDDDRVAAGGDDLLANFLVPAGSTPPQSCAGPDCTVNTIPRLVDRKDTDVADGTVVLQGDEVTYTLTFANEGTGPGDLARDDDLSSVLDDAVLVDGPTVSSPALTATVSGARLEVRGTLLPDQVVTVVYTVRVKPDDDRVADGGDDQLVNALLDPGEQLPPCVAGDPDCTVQPIPRLVDSKSVDVGDGTVVLADDEVTYTLTFANEGKGAGDLVRDDDLRGVLDDAELVDGPTVSDPVLAAQLSDMVLSVTGTLQPDQVVTVTYTVRVLPDAERFERGADDRLANVLLDPGETYEECTDPADPDCTTNGIPRLRDEKSVDPASGAVVLPGDRLTYELTFTNEGEGAGALAREDDLSGALDDAVLVDEPTSSDPALSVTAVTDGRFGVSGTLQPGQVVTVTYVVEVLPDADRVAAGGDDQLLNFLLDPGAPPPATCDPAPPVGYDGVDCSVSLVPRLVESKAVDPVSGSAVQARDVLTYTLTFANDGKGTGDFARVDDLTYVLDDARVVRQPVASSDALDVTRVVRGRFAVRGILAPAEEVTVTYAVEVRPDGRRGDDVVANFLLAPGEDVPGDPTCDPAASTCTISYASEVVARKAVAPRSGTLVADGQELAYRLGFVNRGRGSGDVRWDDDLSEVLDDAVLVGTPRVTTKDGGPTGAVTAEVRGTTLRVRGELAPREWVIVSYVVRVERGRGGDGQLLNFLRPSGTTSQATCRPESDLCTENPVEPPAEPDPDPGPSGSGGPDLPGTGGPSSLLLLLGGALVLTGLGLLGSTVLRRRRARAMTG